MLIISNQHCILVYNDKQAIKRLITAAPSLYLQHGGQVICSVQRCRSLHRMHIVMMQRSLSRCRAMSTGNCSYTREIRDVDAIVCNDDDDERYINRAHGEQHWHCSSDRQGRESVHQWYKLGQLSFIRLPYIYRVAPQK